MERETAAAHDVRHFGLGEEWIGQQPNQLGLVEWRG